MRILSIIFCCLLLVCCKTVQHKKTDILDQDINLLSPEKSYEDLETEALNAIEKAQSVGASKLAPITFSKAKKELELARNIIKIEKNNYDKAIFHIHRARYLAQRSKWLAELNIIFKKERLSYEQIGLWYQEQLEKIAEPFGEKIMFDVSNNDVLHSVKEKIKSMIDYTSELEKKIVELNQKLAETVGEKDAR